MRLRTIGLLAVALLLGACGDDSDEVRASSGETPTDEAAPSEDTAAELDRSTRETRGRAQGKRGEECESASPAGDAGGGGAPDAEAAFREALALIAPKHPPMPANIPTEEQTDGYWRVSEGHLAYAQDDRTIADIDVVQAPDGTWVLNSFTRCGPGQKAFSR